MVPNTAISGWIPGLLRHRRDERRGRTDLAGGPEWRAGSDKALAQAVHVRTSILLWSTASGVILGVFIDATLIGLTVLVSAMIPALSTRLHQRWLDVGRCPRVGFDSVDARRYSVSSRSGSKTT